MHIGELILKETKKRGSVKKLDVSRSYLDLIMNGNMPFISDSLVYKIIKSYNISIEDIIDTAVQAPDNFQPVLRSAEGLSYNKNFIKAVSREENIDEMKLFDLVRINYNALQVRGRLSTLLLNFSSFFPLQTYDQDEGILNKSNYDEFSLRQPIVAISYEHLTSDDFIEVSGEENKIYTIKKEHLSRSGIDAIYTNDKLWRTRFKSVDSNVPREPSDKANIAYIEFKRPINPEIMKTLADEVYNPIDNPKWIGIKGTPSSFEGQIITTDNNGKLKTNYETILTWNGNKTLTVRFFPIQPSPYGALAEGGHNYWPTIDTINLLNRLHNLYTGRSKIQKINQ